MKPKHRHELKTNVLAEWIANFPQWAKENLRMIIYVSVVVVLVAAVYFWRMSEKNVVSVRKKLELTSLIGRLPRGKMQILRARASGVDISYMLIQAADDLQAFAQNAEDDQMAALALIKRAEALRMELHYRYGTVSERDAKAAIDRAKASYTEAVGKSSTNPSLMATAKLGLGLCEEEVGNFEQARQIYSGISTNTSFEGTVATAAAKLRLETMADYRQKVVFKPSPRPSPTETKVLRPEIQLSPTDIDIGPQMENGGFEMGSPLPSSANSVTIPDINIGLQAPNDAFGDSLPSQ